MTGSAKQGLLLDRETSGSIRGTRYGAKRGRRETTPGPVTVAGGGALTEPVVV